MAMLNRPNGGNKPRDAAGENAKRALQRDIDKRREESLRRWEEEAAARKAAQQKSEDERKARTLAIKRQALDAIQAKLKAKTAEKEAIEEKIKRLETLRPDDAQDEIASLRRELERVDREKVGFSSEVIREGQVVKRLKSGVNLKGYEEVD